MGALDFPCPAQNRTVDAEHDRLHAEPTFDEALAHRQRREDFHSDMLRAAIARGWSVTIKNGTGLVTESGPALGRLPDQCDYEDTAAIWKSMMQMAANTNGLLNLDSTARSLFAASLEHAAESLAEIEAAGGEVVYGAPQ